MKVLYYNHNERNVTSVEQEYRDDASCHTTISITEAKQLDKKGEVTDCNRAFITLRQHNWNPDQVEAYYSESD